MNHRTTLAVLPWLALVAWCSSISAQEFTPRAYWPAPVGTRVVVLGYNRSTGDVVTDPSLPIVGVDSDINLGLFAYLHYLSLWGRTSNIIVEVPYSSGTTTGDYDPDQLINVGTNRWALKAELGYMIPIAPRWLLEFELGGWLIGDNDDFLGLTREQALLATGELHLVRRFRPGFWASLDLNYYTGGRSTIGGVELADLQRNSRFGGTIVVPIRGRYAVKVGYSTGVVTESGGDFEMLLLSFTTLFH